MAVKKNIVKTTLANSYATFKALLDSIGGAKKTITVAADINIDTSFTFPTNIDLDFINQSKLVIGAGVVITNGINLGGRDYAHQIIDCALADVPQLVGVGHVRPEWFGGSPSSTSIVNSGAIQKAISSRYGIGGLLKFSMGTYEHDGFTIRYPNNSEDYGFTVVGESRSGTILKHTGSGDAIVISSSYVDLNNLYLQGNTNTTSVLRCNSTDDDYHYAMSRSHIHDITIDGGGGQFGIKFPPFSLENSFDNIYIKKCTQWAIELLGEGTTTSFYDVHVRENANGIYISGKYPDGTIATAMNYRFENCVIESNTGKGIYCEHSDGHYFDTCWFENNGDTNLEFDSTVTNCQYKRGRGDYTSYIDNGKNNQFDIGSDNSTLQNYFGSTHDLFSGLYGGFQSGRTNYAWDSSFASGANVVTGHAKQHVSRLTDTGISDNYSLQILFDSGHPVGGAYRCYLQNCKNVSVPAGKWVFLSFAWKTLDPGANADTEYLLAQMWIPSGTVRTRHLMGRHNNLWARHTLSWYNDTGVAKAINFGFGIGGNSATTHDVYLVVEDIMVEIASTPFAHHAGYFENEIINPTPSNDAAGFEKTVDTGIVASTLTVGKISNINRVDYIDSIPKTYKFTITSDTFNGIAGVYTASIDLCSLPAGTIIHSIKIKHSSAFTGGTIASSVFDLGILGDLQRYLGGYDAFVAPTDTTFTFVDLMCSENHAASQILKLTFTTTVQQLTASRNGVLDLWLTLSKNV